MANTIRTTGFRTLIEALVKARHDTGMTQRDLAEKLGCMRATVANIETGDRRIDVVELVVLGRALAVEPTKLFELLVESISDDELLNNFSRPVRRMK